MTALADGDPRGWAVPTATDIAFALAVLAVVGRGLPTALRAFLLTLAVVDDLIAITVIAVAFTDHLEPVALAGALVPVALFAGLVRARRAPRLLLVVLAGCAWVLVHESGVHATVTGVVLAAAVPVRSGRAERVEHLVRPLSAGFAVPVFAFFAAGVRLDGVELLDPVAVGVVLGLVAGKLLGVYGTTWLLVRSGRAHLDPELTWAHVLTAATLSGIGFTVALLVGDLAFGAGTSLAEVSTAAVLAGSCVAALLSTALLRTRFVHS